MGLEIARKYEGKRRKWKEKLRNRVLKRYCYLSNLVILLNDLLYDVMEVFWARDN